MSEVKVKKVGEEKEKAMAPAARPDFPMLRFPSFDLPLFRGSMFNMNPFALMRQFTDEMDRSFAGFATPKEPEFWMPAIEVKQFNGNLLVKADLPGLDKNDIKIQLTEDTLILEGERKQEKEEKGEEYYRSERTYGKFYRAIALPEGVEVDKVKAEFGNGLLEVTLPCKEKKPAMKEVPVQEAAKAKTAVA